MKTIFTQRRKLFVGSSRPLLYAVSLLLFLLGGLQQANAQNKMVGDGFGGRKWYKPASITAGIISTGNINGQLYMWGNSSGSFILPMPYTASPTSWPLQGAVDPTGLISWNVSQFGTSTDPQLFNTGVNSSGNAIGGINPYPVQGFNNVKLVSVAAGLTGALIKTDGTGWIWGSSGHGDFSLGGSFWGSNDAAALSAVSKPIQVITDAKFVSAGAQHIAFVKNDGTVWTLGDNEYGAYGNNATTPNYWNNFGYGGPREPVYMSTTPVQMTGITNAVRVATFGNRIGSGITTPTGTVILKADGTVWVSGAGGILQSGNSLVPVQVPGLSNIVDIQCNSGNAVALTASGDVYVWGSGNAGPVYASISAQSSSPNTFVPQKINFPPPAAPMVSIEAKYYGLKAGPMLALDENHVLWKWGGNAGAGGNYSESLTPVIDAKHVLDVSQDGGMRYITRTNDYPVDERLWQTNYGGTANLQNIAHALNPDYYKVTTIAGGTAYYEFEPGKYWKNNYALNPQSLLYYPCNLGAWGLGGITTIPSSAAGTIDCSKTQLLPAPVAGTASQADLIVTVNVTTLGDFTPAVTGSGFSLVDPGYVITPTALGIQQFHILVKYDGITSFSTLVFTVSPANPAAGCTLTLSGKKPAIVDVITSDCVPTVGPSLK